MSLKLEKMLLINLPPCLTSYIEVGMNGRAGSRLRKDTGSYIDLFYHWLSCTWQLIIVIRDMNTYFNILSWTILTLTVWAHCSTISQYEGKYCIRLHLPSFLLPTTYTKKCCSSKLNTARVRQFIRTGLIPTITWSCWVRMTKYLFESICCVFVLPSSSCWEDTSSITGEACINPTHNYYFIFTKQDNLISYRVLGKGESMCR